MSGSSWVRRLGKILHTADFCVRRQISTREGLEYLSTQRAQYGVSRREFVAGAAKLAVIGAAAMSMNPRCPSGHIFPGALAAATRDARERFRVHLEHWPSNPLTRGSYTCYRPGQFTSIAGNEGAPVANLYFAGEHANYLYEWQGFMEGAAFSGIQAAKEILQDIKAVSWVKNAELF
jgi:Flavin containing amine oxidoreductase